MDFHGIEMPKTGELIKIIKIGTHHAKSIRDERRPLRADQLGWIRKVFEPSLPGDVSEAYREAEDQLRNVAKC